MARFAPLTIYLDANVLFSACYVKISSLVKLWKMEDVTPVTSLYAIAEVNRHIVAPAQQMRFDRLIAATQLVSDANPALVPEWTRLVEKDRPILAAAIAASVDYLVTGDKRHFAHLYFSRASHVQVISPGDFLALHEERIVS